MSFPCPSCGKDTRIIDSRVTCCGKATRRRRSCICGFRVTTFETTRGLLKTLDEYMGPELFDVATCATPVWP